MSGVGDEFVFRGIFREAELGRKVADGFRQGAATRNGPAKKRHPDYQRRAEELWAQDSNAYKIDVARCIAREYGVSCHTVRAILQKPMARKLMRASWSSPTIRSEERRVGIECVSQCSSRWSTYS